MNALQLSLFIVKLLAGTGVFLVGVHLLTSNIEQLATGKIKDLFEKTANKKLVNVGIGCAVTALIQSSGVSTVLIVGFVNVGIVNLYQATAMIMGANIGTTITGQIAALSAFPFTTYIQVLVFIGMMMSMACKKDSMKKTGLVCSGLGLIFIGLALMSDSIRENLDSIQSLFENVQNPFLLFLIGIILTAIVQSSSAIASVIIAMSVAGLTIGTGGNEVLFIIIGTNIGSCVTAIISSFTAGTDAKRTAFIHLMFNVIGSAMFFILLLCWPDFMAVTFSKWFPTTAMQIAMFHTFSKVFCTVLFLPVSDWFVKVSSWFIKDKEAKDVSDAGTLLDERMLASASLAISQLEKELVRLSDIAMDSFRTAYRSFKDKDRSLIEPTHKLIGQAFETSQNIVNYLIKLSAKSKLADERAISNLHSNLGDIMRIAEIADNFTKYTARMIDVNVEFSDSVKVEFDEMVGHLEKMFALTKEIILNKNLDLMTQLDLEEEEVDHLRKQLIDHHIERLNQGKCKAESSGIFINAVSNLERMGDHLTYIAHTEQQ